MNSLEDRLHELGHRATSEGSQSVDAVIARGQRLRRRRMITRIVAPVAAAAIVAVAIVVPVLGSTPASTSAASAFLVDVGARVGERPDADSRMASVWYVKIKHGSRGGVLETWYSRVGEGMTLKTSATGRVTTSPADLILVAGSSDVTWDELINLPTDPDQLYAWLYEAVGDAGPDRLTEMWAATWDLLRQSPAPTDLRRALYIVASRLPDITIEQNLTDVLGRPAVGIGHNWPGGATRYLVDPATGAVLEHQELIGREVTYRDTFIEQGPAAEVGVRP